MPSLPVEILLGIYLGLLVGVIPALVSWTLGFGFKYITGVTLPGFGVTVLAIALAGVNGGLLALTDPAILDSPAAARVVTSIVVIAMLSMYAHSKGDALGAAAPRRLSLTELGERTLSMDLAELVAGRDEVRLRVVGQIEDVEGYPPLPEDLRADIRGTEVTVPTDLRIAALEERVADRLRTDYDLSTVSVTVDERGRVSVAAAPPFSGLSKRVERDRQAVSVDCLLPSGLARGDEVALRTDGGRVLGTVVSARTGDRQAGPADPPAADATATEDGSPAATQAPTTDGGEGRLTVTVRRDDVKPVLGADTVAVAVRARSAGREFELLSLFRRADRRLRRFTVGADSPLVGQRLAALGLRETHDVDLLAVRQDGEWTLAPAAGTVLAGGDTVFAVGPPTALGTFAEVIA